MHIPMKFVPEPTWQIADIANLLKNNKKNSLFYYNAQGARSEKRYPEVFDDACTTLALMESAGFNIETTQTCLIMGPPSYSWLLTAIACIMSGVEIVALPESLNMNEAKKSIEGLTIDFVALDAEYNHYTCFLKKKSLSLSLLDDRLESKIQPSSIREKGKFKVIAFTSGTSATVKTKCFSINPKSTEYFIDVFYQSFLLDSDDNWTVCHPFSHIVHFEYLLGGLCKGYNLTIASPLHVLLQGKAIQPSCLVMVPSMYEQLLLRVRKAVPKSGFRRRVINLLQRLPATDFSFILATKLQPLVFPELSNILGDKLKVMIIGAGPSSTELKREFMLYGMPLFEGYGLSETNMISCNLPHKKKFGTAGTVWPGVELRLSNEGTLQSRLQEPRSSHYLNVSPEINIKTFLANNWIETGDLVSVDNNHFISIIGRSKDVIITNKGENINPVPIEACLKRLTNMEHVFIYGHNRPYLVAILIPKKMATFSLKKIQEQIDTFNKESPKHERVIDFKIADNFFLTGDVFNTASGKLRRTNIEQHLGKDVARLYE